MAQVPTPAAVFDDWQVLCANDAANCQMVQSAAASADGSDVFLLSISAGAGGDYAVITVPLGVYLAPGAEIRVDGGRPFKVLYELCDQSGCHAGFKLAGPVLAALRQGLDARVNIWTDKTKAVVFPVSLRGFTAAFNDYQARVAQQ